MGNSTSQDAGKPSTVSVVGARADDPVAVADSAIKGVVTEVTAAVAPAEAPKKKICCACPETKKLRDECVVENGEDACAKWIDAHKQCLRREGFNV